MAYQDGVITLQAKIRVRMVKGEESQLIETTCGRLIFNDPIPQDLGFVDRSIPDNKFKLEIEFKVGKKELGKIIDRCIRVHGTARTCEVLDRIKAQGYKYSTKGAITVAVSDATIPAERNSWLPMLKKPHCRSTVSTRAACSPNRNARIVSSVSGTIPPTLSQKRRPPQWMSSTRSS